MQTQSAVEVRRLGDHLLSDRQRSGLKDLRGERAHLRGRQGVRPPGSGLPACTGPRLHRTASEISRSPAHRRSRGKAPTATRGPRDPPSQKDGLQAARLTALSSPPRPRKHAPSNQKAGACKSRLACLPEPLYYTTPTFLHA